MSEPIQDGGPAYPGPAFSQSGYQNGHSMGMSLRDWFAGQAMRVVAYDLAAIGVVAKQLGKRESDVIAAAAYQLADAMLAARVSK